MKGFSAGILFILFGGIAGLFGYIVNYSNTLELSDNKYDMNGTCRFVENQDFNVINKRLNVMVNVNGNEIKLLYPLHYLEHYKKYDSSHYHYFFDTLKSVPFNCKYNTTLEQGYFNDYKSFPSIYQFLTPNDLMRYSVIICGVFGILTLIVLISAVCMCCKKSRINQYKDFY